MEWIADFIKQNGVAVTIAILLLLFLGMKVWPDLMKRLDQAREDLLAQQAANEVRLLAVQEAYEARMALIRAEHAKDYAEARVDFLETLNRITEATTKAIKENTAEIKRIRVKEKPK